MARCQPSPLWVLRNPGPPFLLQLAFRDVACAGWNGDVEWENVKDD